MEAGFRHLGRLPHRVLRPHVRGVYTAYYEDVPGGVRRLEVPHPGIVLIVSLGPSIAVGDHARTSFVAGLHETPVTAGHDGIQHGVQINLTPLGARRILGLPMRELTSTAVDMGDVLGPEGALLGERLASLPDWETRFAALDAVLLRRLLAAGPVRPDVVHAWSRLDAAAGAVPIARLCEELGCSRRHLATRFGEEVGLAPKAMARVLRFDRAVRLVEGGGELAAVAAACGYYDQPHLTREFGALAGRTPAAFAASLMPDGGVRA
jgi:AraC-like DNA-binding protein